MVSPNYYIEIELKDKTQERNLSNIRKLQKI